MKDDLVLVVTKHQVNPRFSGHHHTPEAKAKISAANLKIAWKRRTPEFRNKIRMAQLGRKASEETRAKLSACRKGEKSCMWGKSWSSPEMAASLAKLRISQSKRCKGRGNPMYGRARTDDEKRRISESRILKGSAKGSRNPNWKGGISKSRKSEMATTRYRQWRAAVFERDNFTCQWDGCGKHGGNLEADHIKRWADHPELRYEISNGRTLCQKHHRMTFRKKSSS